MSTIIKKSLDRPEETLTPEGMKIEIVTIDGFMIQRVHGGALMAMVKALKAGCRRGGLPETPPRLCDFGQDACQDE